MAHISVGFYRVIQIKTALLKFAWQKKRHLVKPILFLINVDVRYSIPFFVVGKNLLKKYCVATIPFLKSLLRAFHYEEKGWVGVL